MWTRVREIFAAQLNLYYSFVVRDVGRCGGDEGGARRDTGSSTRMAYVSCSVSEGEEADEGVSVEVQRRVKGTGKNACCV